ncbi:hypothetical protein E1287_18690 [Actinomadura sp. KC06]|uniref:hypothetical protein n=1 Tax=Actinomadura sp. KC06 TaxID=2530369 RepID=UPI0010528FE5|nr:hypothetical protein [Actinomadura sp. KC06]TDD33734.1 hypothetical protein E1287_18690 [Actinomadura sp. KC06]
MTLAEGCTDPQQAIAAYRGLMDRVVVATSHHKKGVGSAELERRPGDITERAVARHHESGRQTAAGQGLSLAGRRRTCV